MASLESLYQETNRQLCTVQERMGELDRLSGSVQGGGEGQYGGGQGLTHRGGGNAERVAAVQKEIAARLEQVTRNCDRLDMLVSKEPAAGNRRMNAKVKVDQLKADVRHVQTSLGSVNARQWQRDREMRDRDQLMSMKFTTNAEAAKSNGGGGGAASTAVLINAALDHNDSLTRSNRAVDDLLGQGSVMLENLRNQRDMIKGFRTKMMDVASVLGMSGTVMRLIERRQEGDKYVLIGGMVITCIVMFLVLRYFT